MPNGGGGPGRSTAGPPAPDDSKPLPPAPAAPDRAAESVAPDTQPQSDLVLRKVQDMLDKGQITPEMEQSLGMSKEELNQFVKKFEKAPKADPGQGRDIEVKPGRGGPQLDPNRTLPDLNPSATVGTKQMRERGTMVQDTVRGNNEGMRIDIPRELRAGFDAYRGTLSKSKTLNPVRRPNAADSNPGSGTK